jgi:hypothetical protein
VDANGDDVLDIFTSNHNFEQHLWIGDGGGGFRDELSAFGLEQYRSFPGVEISRTEPERTEPGLYLYWKGRKTFAVRAHRIAGMGRVGATLRTYSAINKWEGSGLALRPPAAAAGPASAPAESVFAFSTDDDGGVDIEIESPGVPLDVVLDASVPLDKVYVGKRKVSPKAREFALQFQDRHAWAWADYNGDGRIDAFIDRGAIGGTLRALPERVSSIVHDELFVSDGPGPGPLHDIAADAGIEKRDCSGRKVNWVDFNRDGLLDLFVNCEDRGHVGGKYPKQLYQRRADGHFDEVAAAVGLDLGDREVVDLAWFDANGDGYPDLLTFEGDGFFLYRNHGGKSFARESIGRGKFVRSDNPQLRGTADEYWYVDGKLAVADFNGDGALDVFCASKKGNVLLVNDGRGHFTLVDPKTIGMPDESATANWVDYDNDGLVDLHAVPQGLYRQRPDHRFEATGLLAVPAQKYMAAIVSWPDFDNDGRRDVLMALDANFTLWRWWERLGKAHEDRWKWELYAFRNLVAGNHWLELRLAGPKGNPQAIGAQVMVESGGRRHVQVIGLNDGAFFSQGHYRLYFGLGGETRAQTLRIRWPDGAEQLLRDVEGDRLMVFARQESGTGEVFK